MSVYVDDLFGQVSRDPRAKRVGERNGHRWCHMMADTEEELHAFAARLMMKREWFQGDHYDLVPSKRARAVELGAKEVDSLFLVNLRRARLGNPPLVRRQKGEAKP